MPEAMGDDAATRFNAFRPRLTRVAYRMLGSVADAEDAVQEAFVRWMSVDRAQIREPEAFLRRTVTRLCLDALRAARRRREAYVGPWLPDPIVDEPDDDDVTLPLMLALERLSPLERAAFLLHDVFGLGFDEIATTIDRDSAACRQLAARARGHVREARPRRKVEAQHALEIAEAFFVASRSGDVAALGALLAADVSLHADGGGKRPAAAHPMFGFDDVMTAFSEIAAYLSRHPSELVRMCIISGLPGFVTREADGELQTTAFDIEDRRVAAIYVMRNPEKLRHLQAIDMANADTPADRHRRGAKR